MKQFWIRDILKNRGELGACNMLFAELIRGLRVTQIVNEILIIVIMY